MWRVLKRRFGGWMRRGVKKEQTKHPFGGVKPLAVGGTGDSVFYRLRPGAEKQVFRKGKN